MRGLVEEPRCFPSGSAGLPEMVTAGTTFLEEVLDAIPEAVAITHGMRVLHVNQEFCRLFGYAHMDCVGHELDCLVTPDGRKHESEMLMHSVRASGRSGIETVRHTSRGELVDVAVKLAKVRLGGEATGLFVTYRDIRGQKLEAARLQHTALHDGLTGLANRALFLDRVRLTLARLRRRPDRAFAIVFLDLDGFKHVNDTLGHAAGDELLLEIGRRLVRCLRPQDTVARFGGDEFAVLLDETVSSAEAMQVAERIGHEVRRTVLLGDADGSVGASMGVALATSAGTEAEELLRHADAAMYRAKEAGKGRAVLWQATQGK